MRFPTRRPRLEAAVVVALPAAALALALWRGTAVDVALVVLVSLSLVASYVTLLNQRRARAASARMRKTLQRLERTVKESRREARRADKRTAKSLGQLGSALADLSQVLHGVSEMKPLLDGDHQKLMDIRRHLAALEAGEHGGSLRRRVSADMAALLTMYGDALTAPLPVPSGWAMTPQTMQAVLRLIRTRDQVGTIVELGSGVSTSWMAKEVAGKGNGRVISFEHEERFAAVTRGQLDDARLLDHVDLRVAPLVPVELDGQSYLWYQGHEDIDGIDLLVVDGPPGATGPQARYPAVPELWERLNDGCIVVLDDAIREEEQEIIDRWTALSDDHRRIRLVEHADRAAILEVAVSPG